jgi:hypothetical protein
MGKDATAFIIIQTRILSKQQNKDKSINGAAVLLHACVPQFVTFLIK